jgi:uncharacterized membrane protein
LCRDEDERNSAMDGKTTQLQKPHSNRFIELDLIRGFAIAIMIFFHILWDLDYFGLIPLDNSLYQQSKIMPSLFFLLVGICLYVSSHRKPLGSEQIKHLITRGTWILGLALFLTIITFIFFPDRPILFGVLHCIGLCIILCIPVLKLKPVYTMTLAMIIILTGFFINSIPMEHPTIVHLAVGIHPQNIWAYTIDYFPLFPWLGVCLLGVAIGAVLYKDNKRQFRLPDLSRYKPVHLFSWMGQHSLAIYLVHQPIIAGALSVYLLI